MVHAFNPKLSLQKRIVSYQKPKTMFQEVKMLLKLKINISKFLISNQPHFLCGVLTSKSCQVLRTILCSVCLFLETDTAWIFKRTKLRIRKGSPKFTQLPVALIYWYIQIKTKPLLFYKVFLEKQGYRSLHIIC